MIGIQLVIDPVAAMPQIRSEPQPHCQMMTSTPNEAATESMFSTIAFNGRSERAERPREQDERDGRDEHDHQREAGRRWHRRSPPSGRHRRRRRRRPGRPAHASRRARRRARRVAGRRVAVDLVGTARTIDGAIAPPRVPSGATAPRRPSTLAQRDGDDSDGSPLRTSDLERGQRRRHRCRQRSSAARPALARQPGRASASGLRRRRAGAGDGGDDRARAARATDGRHGRRQRWRTTPRAQPFPGRLAAVHRAAICAASRASARPSRGSPAAASARPRRSPAG